MRNLLRQSPSSYSLKPFKSFGLFALESRQNKATPTPQPRSVDQKNEIQTFTIVEPSLLPAGPVIVKNMPGYRLFTVPLADGTFRHYTDRPIPGLIICEEILRKPIK